MLNPSKYIDTKTLVTIMVSAYVGALLYTFVPAASPAAVAAKLTGKSA